MLPPSEIEKRAAEQRRRLKPVLVVFCVAWLVRLIHIFSLKASPIFDYKIGDAARYDAWARTLAEGNWIGEGVFYQAPLYPYFLGLIYSTLGDSLMTVRLVQSLLGAGSCVLLMLAATRFFGKRSGWISGLFLAFYAPSIFLEGLIQKSTLDLFFLTLLLWLISKIAFRPRPRQWIWMGVATGALCLTRENALVLIPVFLFWIALGWFKPQAKSLGIQPSISGIKNRLQWSAAFALGLVLTLGPVALRNYYVGGQLHLTTSQLGPNFYIGNNPAANGTYRPLLPGRGDAQYEQKDAVALAEKEMGKKLSPKEVSNFYLAKSFDFIQQQPGKWLGLMTFKFGLTFNRQELIDTEDQYTVAQVSPILLCADTVFNFGLLVPLAIIGMIVTRSRWQRLWVLYLIMLSFAVTVIAFFVFGRYRFPLAPVMMLFVGPALLFFGDQFRKPESRKLVAAAAAFALLFLGCNLDLVSNKTGPGVTLSNYGVQAMIRSDYTNAERFLLASESMMPENPLVHNNMGVLYRETNRLQLAKSHFEKALALEPTDQKIQSNLEKLDALIQVSTDSH